MDMSKCPTCEGSKRTLPTREEVVWAVNISWSLGCAEVVKELCELLGIEDAQKKESDDGAVLERSSTVGSDNGADLAHGTVAQCPTCGGSGTVDEWVGDHVCEEYPCPKCRPMEAMSIAAMTQAPDQVWYCDCGNLENAESPYKCGDSEPCIHCEDGVARVVTRKQAAAWSQAIALGSEWRPWRGGGLR